MKNSIIKRLLFICIMVISVSGTYAQSKTICVFDLVNETLDSIINIPIDTISQNEKTPHYIGTFDSNIETLELTPPDTNTFPNTQFSLKRKAALDYDLNSYPIRTSVKIFKVEDDKLKNLCSGSVISKKHVLTATHCYVDTNVDTLKYDSLYVCPVYDYGEVNPNFPCSPVSKLYLFKDWSLADEDFTVLELSEPFGESTGWLGIGFDNSGEVFVNDVFYKFSYPNIHFPLFDTFPYNGDTLYYNYGKVELIQNWIGIDDTKGIPGESGSSILQVRNKEEYTSYGVLTFGSDLRHNRFTNKTFYPVKHIIRNDIILNSSYLGKASNIIVFPNPTNGHLEIKNLPENLSAQITIFDTLGRPVYFNPNYQSVDHINLSGLPSGSYYLRIKTDKIAEVRKIVKSRL